MGRRTILILLICILLVSLSSTVFAAQAGSTNEELANFQQLIARYQGVLIAIALSTAVLVFIIHFIRLANSYDHPFLRRQVLRDIFISGITVAMLGGITVIGKIIAATVLAKP